MAPSQEISTPPAGGPTVFAVHNVVSNRPFAAARCCSGTSVRNWATPAESNTNLAVICTAATTHSCQKVSQPSQAATGTDTITTNRSRSAATITGTLRRCSIHGPSGSARTALTTPASTLSSET
nr:hypothetical protein [Actinoplanes rishiriensis]